MIRLLDRIESLEQAVTTLAEMVQQIPGVVAMDTYRQAVAAGIDIESMWHRGAETAAKLCAAVCSDEFDAPMASGILEPTTLGVVGRAGEALTHSQHDTPQQLGWRDL